MPVALEVKFREKKMLMFCVAAFESQNHQFHHGFDLRDYLGTGILRLLLDRLYPPFQSLG